MTLADIDPHAIGWLALAAGAAEFAALVFAVLSFVYGRTFGRVHDVLIGIAAVLTAGLAMLLFPEHNAFDTQIAPVAFGLALAGAFLAALGAVLASTEAVTWFLAQLHVAVGYALIGLWLVILNVTARAAQTFPNRAVNLGILAGTVMALGVGAIPGVLMRSDDEQAAPWISRYVGRAGNLGWLLLYPVWCLWIGLSRL